MSVGVRRGEDVDVQSLQLVLRMVCLSSDQSLAALMWREKSFSVSTWESSLVCWLLISARGEVRIYVVIS